MPIFIIHNPLILVVHLLQYADETNPYSTALIVIAVSTVVIRQFVRKERDLRGIELEHDARSDKKWPTSMLNKRRRRRKKSRKKKAKGSDETTIDLESNDIEEVESFEDDMAPLQKDGEGMGAGVSGQQQHVDVPKVSVINVKFCAWQLFVVTFNNCPLLRSLFHPLYFFFPSTSRSSFFAPFCL